MASSKFQRSLKSYVNTPKKNKIRGQDDNMLEETRKKNRKEKKIKEEEPTE